MAKAEPQLRVSRHLFVAVKSADRPGYVIAREAGITGPILSQLLHGILPVKEQDPRVLRVAEIVGVPPERAFARERRSR